jgi:hypothetical protein
MQSMKLAQVHRPTASKNQLEPVNFHDFLTLNSKFKDCWYDIALRNPFLQNNSTIVFIYI